MNHRLGWRGEEEEDSEIKKKKKSDVGVVQSEGRVLFST